MDAAIAKKLDLIEEELSAVKSMVMANVDKEKKVVKLKGLLNGVVFSDLDVDEAKKSLFGG